MGHHISSVTVGCCLNEMGYTQQANVKSREGSQNLNRDVQFRYLNRQVKGFRRAGDTVISVDTKKKELVGEPLRTGGADGYAARSTSQFNRKPNGSVEARRKNDATVKGCAPERGWQFPQPHQRRYHMRTNALAASCDYGRSPFKLPEFPASPEPASASIARKARNGSFPRIIQASLDTKDQNSKRRVRTCCRGFSVDVY